VSARENDIGFLNLSWLNEHLVALQPEVAAAWANRENIHYFSLYGDKIFPYLQCITHAHEPPLGGQLLVLAMNSLRTSVEWPYRDITLLFQVIQCKHQNFFFISRASEHDASSTVLHRILFVQLLCLFQW
jgi:hypothetical protein